MSDWSFLNQHRCRVVTPTVPECYLSTEAEGFNGVFRFMLDGKQIRCLASDGMGRRHVSVSIEYDRRCPTWDIMCKIKDLFWEPEDCVVQYHPTKSQYVNMHKSCLHLWQPTEEKLPQPPSIMVGIK